MKMIRLPNWKKIKLDPALRHRLEKRAVIVAAIRAFFGSRGFLEAETPVMVRRPGMEPNLDVFATDLRREDGSREPAYLITSPEYSLKKLLAAGFDRLFEITRCFRNGEPWGGSHNPEFTMLEWYRAGADYTALMGDMEELVAEAAQKAVGRTRVAYQGRQLELAPPWPRLTVAEAMDRWCGLDLGRAIEDEAWFRAAAAARGVTVAPTDKFDDIFFRLFLRDVEPRLGMPERDGEVARPVILHEYPRSMAALARLKPTDSRYAERFEAYCLGLELANAFSELNDAAEQRARLEAESAERRAAGKSPWAIDEEFVEAVGLMPEASGIAFGVDRLVMLLTDAASINDILFFPAEDLFIAGAGES